MDTDKNLLESVFIRGESICFSVCVIGEIRGFGALRRNLKSAIRNLPYNPSKLMTDQLAIKLSVTCAGVDAEGKNFQERTRTTAIGKNGGHLLTLRTLQPGARLVLRLLARPEPALDVKVTRLLQTATPYTEWAFEFAAPVEDFWGVHFPAAGGAAGSAPAPGTGPLAEVGEQLILLAAHADDHVRYCRQEVEALRERFAHELQAALDAGGRQLQQLARSTMQTTFRSLLEDLAQRADEAASKTVARLKKDVEETEAQGGKDLHAEAEAQFKKFQERLDKQGRQFTTRVEHFQNELEKILQEAVQEAMADFQAGCTALFRDLLQSSETHKAARPATHRK